MSKHLNPPPAWVKPYEAQLGEVQLPCGCTVGAWTPHVLKVPCAKLQADTLDGLDTSGLFANPRAAEAAEASIKQHVAAGVKIRASKVRKAQPSAKAKQAAFA